MAAKDYWWYLRSYLYPQGCPSPAGPLSVSNLEGTVDSLHDFAYVDSAKAIDGLGETLELPELNPSTLAELRRGPWKKLAQKLAYQEGMENAFFADTNKSTGFITADAPYSGAATAGLGSVDYALGFRRRSKGVVQQLATGRARSSGDPTIDTLILGGGPIISARPLTGSPVSAYPNWLSMGLYETALGAQISASLPVDLVGVFSAMVKAEIPLQAIAVNDSLGVLTENPWLRSGFEYVRGVKYTTLAQWWKIGLAGDYLRRYWLRIRVGKVVESQSTDCAMWVNEGGLQIADIDDFNTKLAAGTFSAYFPFNAKKIELDGKFIKVYGYAAINGCTQSEFWDIRWDPSLSEEDTSFLVTSDNRNAHTPYPEYTNPVEYPLLSRGFGVLKAAGKDLYLFRLSGRSSTDAPPNSGPTLILNSVGDEVALTAREEFVDGVNVMEFLLGIGYFDAPTDTPPTLDELTSHVKSPGTQLKLKKMISYIDAFFLRALTKFNSRAGFYLSPLFSPSFPASQGSVMGTAFSQHVLTNGIPCRFGDFICGVTLAKRIVFIDRLAAFIDGEITEKHVVFSVLPRDGDGIEQTFDSYVGYLRNTNSLYAPAPEFMAGRWDNSNIHSCTTYALDMNLRVLGIRIRSSVERGDGYYATPLHCPYNVLSLLNRIAGPPVTFGAPYGYMAGAWMYSNSVDNYMVQGTWVDATAWVSGSSLYGHTLRVDKSCLTLDALLDLCSPAFVGHSTLLARKFFDDPRSVITHAYKNGGRIATPAATCPWTEDLSAKETEMIYQPFTIAPGDAYTFMYLQGLEFSATGVDVTLENHYLYGANLREDLLVPESIGIRHFFHPYGMAIPVAYVGRGREDYLALDLRSNASAALVAGTDFTTGSFEEPHYDVGLMFIGETKPLIHNGGKVVKAYNLNKGIGTVTLGGPSGCQYTAVAPGFDYVVLVDDYNKVAVALGIMVFPDKCLYADLQPLLTGPYEEPYSASPKVPPIGGEVPWVLPHPPHAVVPPADIYRTALPYSSALTPARLHPQSFMDISCNCGHAGVVWAHPSEPPDFRGASGTTLVVNKGMPHGESHPVPSPTGMAENFKLKFYTGKEADTGAAITWTLVHTTNLVYVNPITFTDKVVTIELSEAHEAVKFKVCDVNGPLGYTGNTATSITMDTTPSPPPYTWNVTQGIITPTLTEVRYRKAEAAFTTDDGGKTWKLDLSKTLYDIPVDTEFVVAIYDGTTLMIARTAHFTATAPP